VTPEVSKVEIRDFSAYQPAVDEGYRAMIEALDKLERPVQELRRRESLEQQRAKTSHAAALRQFA
jgi:NTE family protein